jgi:hypothetical protein
MTASLPGHWARIPSDARNRGAERVDGRIGEKDLMTTFAVGDHVRWNSEAGFVTGVITKKHTRNVEYKGHMRHCSGDDPQYEIASDKTDHIAMHKTNVLTKIE